MRKHYPFVPKWGCKGLAPATRLCLQSLVCYTTNADLCENRLAASWQVVFLHKENGAEFANECEQNVRSIFIRRGGILTPIEKQKRRKYLCHTLY